MARSFLFVSSFNPEAARRAVPASPLEPDLVVIVVLDGLDVLGVSAFTLDEAGDAGHRRVTLFDRTDDHVVENADQPDVRVVHACADGARDRDQPRVGSNAAMRPAGERAPAEAPRGGAEREGGHVASR